MRPFDISAKSFGSILIVLAALLCASARGAENKQPVRTPDEIIGAAGGEITPEVVIELFTNCTVDDAAHKDVKVPSREKLITLGPKALPTLLKEYLPSEALYHRIEIVNIVEKIGHPAAEFLIPYLRHAQPHGRQYAAYLLGQTAAASKLEDPYRLGPLPEDVPALEALVSALSEETDWQVIGAMVGAIGAMRDPAKVDLIASHLSHDEQSVRLSAAISLGKIPHITSMLRLMDALEDVEATVRGAAVLQLATAANGDIAFNVLMSAAGADGAPELRRLYALESLARYFDAVMADKKLAAEDKRLKQQKQACKLAKKLLKSPSEESWNIRGHAVKLIASSRHDGAAKFLREYATREKHPFVRSKIDLALSGK